MIFGCALALWGFWTALAFYVQLKGPMLWPALFALSSAGYLLWRIRETSHLWGWIGFCLCALGVAAWFFSISPRQDRAWAPEVSRNVKAEVEGRIVTLTDIRDFHWKTPTEALPRWHDDRFDLDQLTSVDMITSVWSYDSIAHLLVSFGFEDGRQIAFSAEVRRKDGEEFSELGGFFRQFELALIAATERDIVHLRTDIRRETVSLYPVKLSPTQREQMFLAYAGLAQSLEAAPRFYNTITANCTTVVWKMARLLDPSVPLHPALLLSGYLPNYLEGLGYLGGTGSLQDKRAAALLPPAGLTADQQDPVLYSQQIRQTIR